MSASAYGPGQPCPYCGSLDVAGVILGGPTAQTPFAIACPGEASPSFGCCSCGGTYGDWLLENT